MSGARWAVKLKSGEYACVTCRVGCCLVSYDTPSRIENHGKARAVAKRRDGRVVRLLTPAESRRKAAAEALRELAVELRAETLGALNEPVDDYDGGLSDAKHLAANEAEARADALWPRKGAGHDS